MSSGEYIDNVWALEQALTNENSPEEERKKAFSYKKHKEEFLNYQKREDQKKTIEREAVYEIYQLIGFDSVFQAVWFQAITALKQDNLSCRASALPIIISILVSFATIIGIHSKFQTVYKQRKGFYDDRLMSAVFQAKFKEFEHPGPNFDWKKRLKPSKIQPRINEVKLAELHRFRVFFLLFLTILSALFAWLLAAVVCDKYP